MSEKKIFGKRERGVPLSTLFWIASAKYHQGGVARLPVWDVRRPSADVFRFSKGGRPPLLDFGRLQHLRTPSPSAELVSRSASRQIS